MRKLAYAIPMLFLVLAAAAQTDATAQSLIANSKALLEASKTGNVAAPRRLLASDFRYIGSEGKWHSRADFVEKTKDADLKDFRMYNEQAIPLNSEAVLVTFDCIIHEP